jgi:hypothetical protein
MKFYKVFKKSHEKNEDSVLVQTGFCWTNFFFGMFWAAYKKIWDLVIIDLLFISIFMALARFYPNYLVQIIAIFISIQVLLSFYVTNYFLKWKLIRAGYKEIDLIASHTEDEALLRFLSSSKKT